MNDLIIKLRPKKRLKIQADTCQYMPEIRKLLRLSKSAFAMTIPTKYRKVLKLEEGDYLIVSLWDDNTLKVRRHKAPKKP